MFNKYLLLCLTLIACNALTHDERIEQMMLNAHNNRIFDLNNKIEQLQHKKETIATCLASNQSSDRNLMMVKCATCIPLMYALWPKVKDFSPYLNKLINKPNASNFTGCFFELINDRWFVVAMAQFVITRYKLSIDQNSLSTKIKLRKQTLQNLDTRIAKLIQEKNLLEKTSSQAAQTSEQSDNPCAIAVDQL